MFDINITLSMNLLYYILWHLFCGMEYDKISTCKLDTKIEFGLYNDFVKTL